LTVTEQIRSLETLAKVDADLKRLEDQLSAERATLDTLTASRRKLDVQLTSERMSLATTEKKRGELVGEVRSTTQQIEHSRDKLGRARNERESNAAQRELEELRKLLRDHEDELTKVTGESEVARQRILATETQHLEVSEELAAKGGTIQKGVTVLERDVSKKREERTAMAKQLPAQLFRRYEIIRIKKGSAVAQTTDGTCRACNMALPPQLFHRLRREPVIELCPSCQRLIYFLAPSAAREVES
jgi:predicted  nucleic acid-binding Zn-ribbon protein